MKGTLLQWRLEPVAVISLGNLMGDAQLGAYPLADEGRNVQTQITKWKWWFVLCMRFKYFFPSAWFWGSFLWIAKHFFKVSSVLVAVSLKETPLICTMQIFRFWEEGSGVEVFFQLFFFLFLFVLSVCVCGFVLLFFVCLFMEFFVFQLSCSKSCCKFCFKPCCKWWHQFFVPGEIKPIMRCSVCLSLKLWVEYQRFSFWTAFGHWLGIWKEDVPYPFGKLWLLFFLLFLIFFSF